MIISMQGTSFLSSTVIVYATINITKTEKISVKYATIVVILQNRNHSMLFSLILEQPFCDSQPEPN